MTLDERIEYFNDLFDDLQSTNSIVDKKRYITTIPDELRDDFNYILECLSGMHPFGFTYYYTKSNVEEDFSQLTVKELLDYLHVPIDNHNLTENNIYTYMLSTSKYADFLEPIVNRTLKLGIGRSLFEKTDLSPMLAKKYEGKINFDYFGYYITEKLDGNRCIAHFDFKENEWKFTSRNGKEMKVWFDMSDFDETLIYDGEVLSPEQVELSIAIYNHTDIVNKGSFNSTSGSINSIYGDKNLVYNIFDVIDPTYSGWKYQDRRRALNEMSKRLDGINTNVRILPVLEYYDTYDNFDKIYDLLDYVTSKGGEGLMINLGGAVYEHKRTDKLLKLKKVQTIDMKVIDIEYGTGKYEGLIGALICQIITDDGKKIECKVGSGLDDRQRYEWSLNITQIIGKIVEVAYFSLSQDSSKIGTNVYSLRFPRLKKVRYDKNNTSEY